MSTTGGYEDFYRQYYRRVFAYLVKRGVARPKAEELTQEVFLRVWRHWNGLDPSKNPEPWLWTITKRIMINHWRDSTKTTSHLSDSSIQLPPDPRPGPEYEAIDDERVRALWSVIDGFPKKRRRVFILYYHYGYRAAEIAKILKVTTNTVRAHLHQGRKALDGEFEQRFPELLALYPKPPGPRAAPSSSSKPTPPGSE